jgi:hypothetical protein
VEICRGLIDPHKAERRSLPYDDRDLYIAANNARVLSYDNLSRIPEKLSNSFCSLATGGGYGTRTLYTDQEEQVFEAMRPLILNGVADFITKHDLAERTIGLELPVIPDRDRRTEREFRAQFRSARPAILGALLDAVAHGLKMLPSTQSEDWPRMADFAQWVTACEGALWQKGTFARAYAGNRKTATDSAIDDDAVATALRAFVNGRQPNWEGTTGNLLNELTALVGDRQSNSKNWPKEARGLTSHLQNAKGSLRRVGIDISYGARNRKGRKLIITYMPPEGSGDDSHYPHHSHWSVDFRGVQGEGRNHRRPATGTRPTPAKSLPDNESDGGDGGECRPEAPFGRRQFSYRGEDHEGSTPNMVPAKLHRRQDG